MLQAVYPAEVQQSPPQPSDTGGWDKETNTSLVNHTYPINMACSTAGMCEAVKFNACIKGKRATHTTAHFELQAHFFLRCIRHRVCCQLCTQRKWQQPPTTLQQSGQLSTVPALQIQPRPELSQIQALCTTLRSPAKWDSIKLTLRSARQKETACSTAALYSRCHHAQIVAPLLQYQAAHCGALQFLRAPTAPELQSPPAMAHQVLPAKLAKLCTVALS